MAQYPMTQSSPAQSAPRLASQDGLVSVILPAHNEEAYIGPCLRSVLSQDIEDAGLEVIVMANACHDRTVEIALGFKRDFKARGWVLRVLRTAKPGKLGALTCADKMARGTVRVFLDADVICEPELMGQLHTELSQPTPLYGSGTLTLAPAKSWITRRYGAFWSQLPFMQGKAPGAGVFAVNTAGRARWTDFPDIISDDTFVRLSFAPSERIQVPARYHWPLVEGFSNLVRVRQRQNAGVEELRDLHPALFGNDDKTRPQIAALFLRHPVDFLVYAAVSLAVRFSPRRTGWTRGR